MALPLHTVECGIIEYTSNGSKYSFWSMARTEAPLARASLAAATPDFPKPITFTYKHNIPFTIWLTRKREPTRSSNNCLNDVNDIFSFKTILRTPIAKNHWYNKDKYRCVCIIVALHMQNIHYRAAYYG